MNTQLLTDTFNAGLAHGKSGENFSRRLTIKQGKQRDFWEAGYHKGFAAYTAERKRVYNSDDAVAARAQHTEDMARWIQAIFNMDRGDYTQANRELNKMFGL